MYILPKRFCMGNHDFAFLSALVPSRTGLIFCSSWDQYPNIIQYHLMSLSGLAEGESLSLFSKGIPSGWRNGAVGEPSHIVLCPGIPEYGEHFTMKITLSCTLLLMFSYLLAVSSISLLSRLVLFMVFDSNSHLCATIAGKEREHAGLG